MCRTFAERVESMTTQLRAAPPERVRLDWTAPRRGRLAGVMVGRSMASVAASTVAFVAFAGIAYDALRPDTEVVRSLPVLVIDVSGADTTRETQDFLHGLRDASLAREVGATFAGPRRPGVQDA